VKFLKEVTEWEYPNHTYAFEKGQCIGYIKQGTKELLRFNKPSKQFSKSRRKFVEVTI
jgi:hypothetical protein